MTSIGYIDGYRDAYEEQRIHVRDNVFMPDLDIGSRVYLQRTQAKMMKNQKMERKVAAQQRKVERLQSKKGILISKGLGITLIILTILVACTVLLFTYGEYVTLVRENAVMQREREDTMLRQMTAAAQTQSLEDEIADRQPELGIKMFDASEAIPMVAVDTRPREKMSH